MADTTGMDYNRFGMSVKQTADVHGAGEKKTAMRGRHTHRRDRRRWRANDTGIRNERKDNVRSASRIVYVFTMWRTKKFASSLYSSRTIDCDK